MSDETPQTYTYIITVLTLPSGATAPAATTWQVTGSYLNVEHEAVTITDENGGVIAIAPLGAIVVREDAVVAPAGTS